MSKKYLLKVQEYLATHSLNDLSRDHGVNHRIVGHKMTLNYNQIEARDNDPISQECRGLVLGHDYEIIDPNAPFGDTEILAWPFKRFFNYGQEAALRVNFDQARFYEKLDGTCIIFYWDHHIDKWCVATRSIPEANLPVDGFAHFTFTTLFEKAIEDTIGAPYVDWLAQAGLDKDYTYIFELCTPFNKVVVQYATNLVWFIGVRNRITGQEFKIEQFNKLMVPVCPSYNLSSVKEMVEFVEKHNPLEHEGIVVCDNLFRRIKVKNPAYVAYNRINDSTANSPRAVMQLVLDEKVDDLTPVLKEYVLELAKIYQKNVRHIIQDFIVKYQKIQEEVDSLGNLSDKVRQKSFAVTAKESGAWLAPVMCIYTGKSRDIHHWFEQQKNPNGEFKKSFLEELIRKSDKLEENES